MLRKIDCIMIRVENIEAAASYYADVFGLHPRWSGDGSIGLVFQETDVEIVLHCDPNIPSSVEVYYLVDDVLGAVADYAAQGCQVLVAPFRHYNWEMCGNQRPIRHTALHPRYDEGSSSFQPCGDQLGEVLKNHLYRELVPEIEHQHEQWDYNN
jgi:hypothetical protein